MASKHDHPAPSAHAQHDIGRKRHLLDEEKARGFNMDVPFAEIVSSHSEVDRKRVYCSRALIVDNVVRKHIIPDETNNGYRNYITHSLKPVHADKYNFTMSNISRPNIIVKFLCNGNSFHQALRFVLVLRCSVI